MTNSFRTIETVDELKRALTLQRAATGKAALELRALEEKVLAAEHKDDQDMLDSLIVGQQELLLEYAALPTLTEHTQSEALRGAMQSGATFGVALIVGEVLLKQIAALCPPFPTAQRILFMVMLNEMSKTVSEDADLVETFIRCMRFEFSEEASALSIPAQRERLRLLVRPLVSAMITVAERYALMENLEAEGYDLTALGVRVLLHLIDAQAFIEMVSAAHSTLKKKK